MADKDSNTSGTRAALGVGLATLVTILVAVLLTTFSVLALVSARADLRLSTKTIESTTAYYAADSQAEKWLADVDAVLSSSSSSPASALSAAGYKIGSTADGQIMLSQAFVLDTNRNLEVEIVVNNNGEINVNKWQVTARPQQ